MQGYKTSTSLYRSCAAIARFSGTFDLILFEAVDFEFIVEKVWFGKFCIGLFWIDGLDQPCFALVEFGSLVCLIEFGLVWFGCSTDEQTNNNYLILINLICEFVFGYSTDKQTN